MVNLINTFIKRIVVNNYLKKRCSGGHLAVVTDPVYWSLQTIKSIIKYKNEMLKTLKLCFLC